MSEAAKVVTIMILLSIVCAVGVAYDAWAIYLGHADRISLYGPACGLFAVMLWWFDRRM